MGLTPWYLYLYLDAAASCGNHAREPDIYRTGQIVGTLMRSVTTVTGDVTPDELGITLPHEHLLFDLNNRIDRDADRTATEMRRLDAPVTLENIWWMQDKPQPTSVALDNRRVTDVDLAVEEAQRFAHLGGGTIVEPNGYGMGRDPRGLQQIAHRTGLNVVAGCGYYLPSSYPPDMDQKSAEDIAEDIVADAEEGIGETDVRPGVIGEIGSTQGYADHDLEQRSYKGAAIAQQETGLPITVHPPYFFQEAHAILDTLEDAGADLENVIMGHLDGTIPDDDALEYHRSLGDRGVYLEFDTFGRAGYRPAFDAVWPLDEARIDHLAALQETHPDQILLSQDICKKVHLTSFGGFGFDYILRSVVPRLRRRGFTETDVERLLESNPASALRRAR